ncbi:MAG: chemotaxis protein CheX [Clostridia bacterium]
MNAEHINPFIEASQAVLKSAANMDITLGKLYMKTSPYPSDTLAIIIGLTGQLRGQVIFSMSKDIACKIASAMMMGMPVTELDEISKSAVTEATNMILGNTATILYNRGIAIDITPPSLLIGDNMQISTNKMKTVCVPLNIDSGGVIELDISVAD